MAAKSPPSMKPVPRKHSFPLRMYIGRVKILKIYVKASSHLWTFQVRTRCILAKMTMRLTQCRFQIYEAYLLFLTQKVKIMRGQSDRQIRSLKRELVVKMNWTQKNNISHDSIIPSNRWIVKFIKMNHKSMACFM